MWLEQLSGITLAELTSEEGGSCDAYSSREANGHWDLFVYERPHVEW